MHLLRGAETSVLDLLRLLTAKGLARWPHDGSQQQLLPYGAAQGHSLDRGGCAGVPLGQRVQCSLEVMEKLRREERRFFSSPEDHTATPRC